MSSERQQQALARAKAAGERAREARQRADAFLQRGDEWLAQVEESFAHAQDLIVTNTEFLIARLTRPEPAYRTSTEKIEGARAGQRRALGYARIHRQRGEITRAQFHEEAAEALAVLAETLEADRRLKPQPQYVHNAWTRADASVNLEAPRVAA